ncbi:hydrogenase maturation protease [Robertkochia sediminum]|uniref:hydrogenase maturation protease n=1 Tax=Robertkochia sediminum TaxID=2785326 RepID=UPI0019316AD7|nr:hydrogenase maturation protease [Robertkochia sediminum]MBL7472314.1 hydrogenase maturation protease [Robertkochia sediminum]
MRKQTSDNPVAISSDSFFYEKDKSDATLILGVGNYLMGDEGVGVQVIQQMAGMDLPERTDILDGGTGGFLLLNCFESYKNIIFIDATMDGEPEGTVTLRKPKFASDFPSALSVHDVGLKDMIEAVYLMEMKPELYLITISVSEVVPMCVDLSPEVQKAIPEVINTAFTLASELANVSQNS